MRDVLFRKILTMWITSLQKLVSTQLRDGLIWLKTNQETFSLQVVVVIFKNNKVTVYGLVLLLHLS